MPFAEILKKTPGSRSTAILDAAAPTRRPKLDAYLELHIEQGPVLDEEGVPIGIVDHPRQALPLVHVRRARRAMPGPSPSSSAATLSSAWPISPSGRPGMSRRITTAAWSRSARPTSTRARSRSFPGGPTFPSNSAAADAATLAALERSCSTWPRTSLRRAGLIFRSRIVDATPPVTVPARLAGDAAEECDKLGYSHMTFPSGAGHDAQILAAKAPRR